MNIALTVASAESNMCQARRCLTLIRDIAARGAMSQDPEQVGYALQELSQVLLERTGTEEIHFEPIPATMIGGLEKLLEELDFVDGSSQDLAHKDAGRNSWQWN
jgi:hypothetical protein